MIDVLDAFARLERPEHTGENRCLPCTAVNVAIAFALAVGIGVAGSALVGALAFACCLLLVYLRGYLIPGTPTLTRRYLPDRIRSWFGKADTPGPERRPTIETADLEAAVETLSTADVVRSTANGDGLRLTDDFRERWTDGLPAGGAVESPADAVALLVDADEIDSYGEATVELDGTKRLRWESDAALAADVAADRELRTRLDGWEALEPADRRDVLAGLRLLRERCPACDGPLETHRERIEHCCRRPRVALETDCETCGRSIAALAVGESSPLIEWVPTGDAVA
ncbi:hypothetical protein C477_19040 [Haloterrigena salina JCM 13891]|uniref:Uncharacterized protein n=1 Tax=Haloterrigena salina JCM 13891 TaxID=1227488 RepID=M0BYY9_9EURY|nr:hypothetical protein [Haloterrigena salina]ELZ15312.1 hypothetical protein C477_19040 [Haloterrigena salina JCM 13891]